MPDSIVRKLSGFMNAEGTLTMDVIMERDGQRYRMLFSGLPATNDADIDAMLLANTTSFVNFGEKVGALPAGISTAETEAADNINALLPSATKNVLNDVLNTKRIDIHGTIAPVVIP